MNEYFQKINELLAAGKPFVSVTLVDTWGSAPIEAGAKMIVTQEGLHYGTVGGGALELQAMERAQALLKRSSTAHSAEYIEWNLTGDLGMTCGGSVKLFLETFALNTWDIAVFGAGHVGQALVNLLLGLECKVTCIDTRPEWLARLPESARLSKLCASDMASRVKDLPDGAFVISVTTGHEMDLPILIECLKQERFPFIGVIGSANKAAHLRNSVVEAGFPEEYQNKFYCPVGLPLGSNHPQEIAVSITAQLLQERDRLRSRT